MHIVDQYILLLREEKGCLVWGRDVLGLFDWRRNVLVLFGLETGRARSVWLCLVCVCVCVTRGQKNSFTKAFFCAETNI